MGHNKWDSDDFLDDFLDFDYGKKVPERSGADRDKQSAGSPADDVKIVKKDNKRYGLGDDAAREYELLRHGEKTNARQETPQQKSQQKAEPVLRSSGAYGMDIPEPISAKKPSAAADKAAPSEIQQPTSSKRFAAPDIPEPLSARKNSGNSTPEPVAEASTTSARSAGKSGGLFSKRKKNKEAVAAKQQSHKIMNASEVANEAFDAAKKFVASAEDTEPEIIPPLSAARGGAKSEVDELFAELGEPVSKDAGISSEDNKAIKRAQEEAYDRYRSNYNKKLRKQNRPNKVGFIPKWLSRLYVLALAVFVAVMLIVDVLPFGVLIAFFAALGLLSLIIIMQLRREKVRTGVRVLASITALALIIVFGVGSAYAMGTLSFLDATSVKNDKKVGSIIREPFNLCITGIDVDGTIDEEGRSDVNMIVTVNPKTEQILLTSIPRDYQIYMPDKDYAMDKLTHTGFYGIDTTIGAEENLLDTRINYYVKVNFTTVETFIDAIGGVDVYSEFEFEPVKKKGWTVQEGWNHMDGSQALAFARERKAFIDGDNQRIKNQQAVFEAIIKKATSSKTVVLSYNKILSGMRDYFKMSISSSEIRSLIKLQLAKDPDWKIFKNTITGGDGLEPTYSTGSAYAYVMTQDETSIENAKTLMNAVLEGKTLDKDEEDTVYVVGGEEQETEESGETSN